MPLAFIPSPSIGEIHLGPLPLRGYSLLLILGIAAAVVIALLLVWAVNAARSVGEPSYVGDVAEGLLGT